MSRFGQHPIPQIPMPQGGGGAGLAGGLFAGLLSGLAARGARQGGFFSQAPQTPPAGSYAASRLPAMPEPSVTPKPKAKPKRRRVATPAGGGCGPGG